MMNEPHRGYIDLPSLHKFDYNTDLHLGTVRAYTSHHTTRRSLLYADLRGVASASAFQSFLLGAGHPTAVDRWTRSFPMPTKCTGQELLNPQGRKAWREDGPTGGRDLWEMHGVWEWDSAKNAGAVLRETYFVNDPTTGRKVRLFLLDSGKGCAHGSTDRLVHGFLLSSFEALDRTCAQSHSK